MVNFPGGFPGRMPGIPGWPPGPSSPQNRPPGWSPWNPNVPGQGNPPNRPPGWSPWNPNVPGQGNPPNRPPGWSPWNPNVPGQGNPPNRPPGGQGNPPPPPASLINQFQVVSQNPQQAQSLLQPQGGMTTFAAGCDGRWTIVLLRNGQVFLMYVISSNVVGSTVGIIWPNFTFASFPSSSIAAYSCS